MNYYLLGVLVASLAFSQAAEYDRHDDHDGTYEYGGMGCKPPTFVDGSYYPPLKEICPVGTVLHFSCKAGFNLRGSKSVKCAAGGVWDPPKMPICYKYCPKPVAPQYGSYEPTKDRYEPGNKCQYKCKSGYELKGDEYATCLDSGHWSHKKSVSCQDIDECSHYKTPCGKNSVCHNTLGGYKCICKSGFHKQSDGICYAKACEVPYMPEHCSYSPSHKKSWYFGDKIHFHCPRGYQLKGASYATCLHGGKWDNKAPQCYRVDVCYAPSLHDNVGYRPSGQQTWYVGQKISFYCHDGYGMKGEKYATCKPGGKWDYTVPYCNRHAPKACYLPQLPQHCGYTPYDKKTWYADEKIHYHCPKGYNLIGSAYATCSYGRWDNNPPKCIKHAPKACYLPQLPQHCSYTPYDKKTWYADEKIHYHCPKGYNLVGSAYATCSYGRWDNNPPKCIKPASKVCYLPQLPQHCGYTPHHKTSWYDGEKIHYHCPAGHKLVGSSYATCSYGHWDNDPPKCIRPQLCYAPSLTHAHAHRAHYAVQTQKSWHVGEKIRYVCPKGLKVKGYDHATCLPGGKWDNPAPLCVRPSCGVPSLPEHCSYFPIHQKSWLVGHSIRFHCPKGFVMKGYGFATCTYDGTWTNPPPKCTKIHAFCKSPVLHSHSRYANTYKDRYEAGEVTGFACPPGFYLKGYRTARCLYNGRWSNPPPICFRQVYRTYRPTHHYGHGQYNRKW